MLGVEKLLNEHNFHLNFVSLLPSVHAALQGVFFTATPSNPDRVSNCAFVQPNSSTKTLEIANNELTPSHSWRNLRVSFIYCR